MGIVANVTEEMVLEFAGAGQTRQCGQSQLYVPFYVPILVVMCHALDQYSCNLCFLGDIFRGIFQFLGTCA